MTTANQQIARLFEPRQAPERKVYWTESPFLTVEERAHNGQSCVPIGAVGTWAWVRFDDGAVIQVESWCLK